MVLAWVFLFAIASETVHFLQYAILALPILALTGRVTDTLAWATLLGTLDEGYQYFVLNRHWEVYLDFNDIVLDLLGAAIGVLIALTVVADPPRWIRPTRSISRSLPVRIAAAGVATGFVLYRLGYLQLHPALPASKTLILLSRARPESVFWTDIDWGKSFHILQPVPGLVVLGLLLLLYARLDVHVDRARRLAPGASSLPGAPTLEGLYRRLQRVTGSTSYLPAIDGLRFVAILAVILFHVETRLPGDRSGGATVRALLATGNIGVQLFFTISGFILSVPFLNARNGTGPPLPLGRYLARRVVRLGPPYLISLLLLIAFGLTRARELADWPHLVAGATFLQFYLAMPLLAWLFFRGDRPWIRRCALLLLCVPMMVRQAFVPDPFPDGLFLVDQFPFFAVGMVLADIFVTEREGSFGEPGAAAPGFDLLALAAFASIPLTLLWLPAAARFLTPLEIGLGAYAALRSRFCRTFLELRWITVLGGMGYTVYLYHRVILDLLVADGVGFPFPATWTNLVLLVPGFVVVVFAVSALLFVAFERPFMRWRPGSRR